jgi:hypothetical protein
MLQFFRTKPKVNRVTVPKVNNIKVPKVNRIKVPKVNRKKVPKVNRIKMPKVNRIKVPKVNRNKVPKVNRMALQEGTIAVPRRNHPMTVRYPIPSHRIKHLTQPHLLPMGFSQDLKTAICSTSAAARHPAIVVGIF